MIVDEKDLQDQAMALSTWFVSQDIDPDQAMACMIFLLGFLISHNNKDIAHCNRAVRAAVKYFEAIKK